MGGVTEGEGTGGLEHTEDGSFSGKGSVESSDWGTLSSSATRTARKENAPLIFSAQKGGGVGGKPD